MNPGGCGGRTPTPLVLGLIQVIIWSGSRGQRGSGWHTPPTSLMRPSPGAWHHAVTEVLGGRLWGGPRTTGARFPTKQLPSAPAPATESCPRHTNPSAPWVCDPAPGHAEASRLRKLLPRQDPLHCSLASLLLCPVQQPSAQCFIHSSSSFPSDAASPAQALTTCHHGGAVAGFLLRSPHHRHRPPGGSRGAAPPPAPLRCSMGADALRVALKPQQHQT